MSLCSILPFGRHPRGMPRKIRFYSLRSYAYFVELTSSVLSIYLRYNKCTREGCIYCIGVARFELTTFCSQSRRSTRLSYTPRWFKYSK